MHVLRYPSINQKQKKKNINDGIRFYLQSDLGTVFCRLLKLEWWVKNTFNSVEWNILLVLYFRFERHFLFFFLKHKKEKCEMRKRTTMECQQEAEQKWCEENIRRFSFTLWQFSLSGRYAVTSSLLTFIYLFFFSTNTDSTQAHTLGMLIGYLCLGENPTENFDFVRILLLKQH